MSAKNHDKAWIQKLKQIQISQMKTVILLSILNSKRIISLFFNKIC